MDMMMILLLLLMLPQLLGGIGGLLGGQQQQPNIVIYTGGTGADEDNGQPNLPPNNTDSTFPWSANPAGMGDEDNPFDLALLGAAVGAGLSSWLGPGALLGAGIGAVGGFLVDLWWL
jgi:hypothetical protein